MIQQTTAKNFVDSLEDSSVQLFYFDPPFGSEREHRLSRYAFQDPDASAVMQMIDFDTIKAKLKSSGLVAIHCDYRLSHYMRLACDSAFGHKNFVNEIVWCYKTGGATKKRLSRKHDVVIVYSKNAKHTFNPLLERSYNRGNKPYGFKGVEEFEDENGHWHTLVNMKDYWTDIPALGRTDKERVNYPTQKPLALAERVIQLFSDPLDVVCDPFCGSGTHLLAAFNKGRVGIGCDISLDAVNLANERLNHANL